MPILKATINDVPALAKLVNSAYRGETSKKGWTTEAYLIDGQRIDEQTLTEYLDDPDATILKYENESGQLIGCVYLKKEEDRLYLGMLTVDPEQQANGIGRQMLHEAERIAYELNCPFIKITVITTRHELLDWYERRGYRRTGKLLPFHVEEKYGIPRTSIQLAVLEKEI